VTSWAYSPLDVAVEVSCSGLELKGELQGRHQRSSRCTLQQTGSMYPSQGCVFGRLEPSLCLLAHLLVSDVKVKSVVPAPHRQQQQQRQRCCRQRAPHLSTSAR
jgi:hypothetical protein